MKKIIICLVALSSISVFAQSELKVGRKAIHTGTLGAVTVKIIASCEGGYVPYNKEADITYGCTSESYLASMKGCLNDLCVGDKAIHLGTLGRVEVKIIGIRKDGNYVAAYRKDKVRYGNVRKSELAKL